MHQRGWLAHHSGRKEQYQHARGGKVLGSPPTTQQKQARSTLDFQTGGPFLEAVVREVPHPTPSCVGRSWCSVPEQSGSTEAHRRVEPP